MKILIAQLKYPSAQANQTTLLYMHFCSSLIAIQAIS